jgi:hypothetical protein
MADTWEALLRLADGLEPEARRRFLQAVSALRDRMDVDAIARAVSQRGSLIEALRSIEGFEQDLEPLLDVAQQAFIEAGQLSARQLGDHLGTAMRFDVVNPAAVLVARQTAADLVVQITTETQLAIRNVITRAFTEGLTRRDASNLIRPLIGLTDRQAMSVMNYRAGLLEHGVAADRVSDLADRYAVKQLKRRAENIARTEIMTASNGGQDALWQQAVERRLLDPGVERKWTVTPDDRLCRFCRAMNGQTRRLGEDFISPLNGRRVRFPPLHPSCRCALVLKTRRVA